MSHLEKKRAQKEEAAEMKKEKDTHFFMKYTKHVCAQGPVLNSMPFYISIFSA